MSLGGSSNQAAGVSQTQIPAWLQSDWEGLRAQANKTAAIPFQAYTGEVAPGLSSGQTAAINNIYNVANNGTGQGPVSDAITTAEGATNRFTNPVTEAWTGPAAHSSSASIDPNATPTVGAQTGASGMAAYQNPYEDQVVQSTLGDIDRQRQQAINGNSSAATLQGGEGGAFGARAGVSDSLTNEAALRAAASAAGSLRTQGFDTAASNAQTDAARALAAGQSNQGVIAQALGQNAGYAQQTGLANAASDNATAQAQAALKAQVDQGNQSAGVQQANTQTNIASTLADLGKTQQGLALGANQALLAGGNIEQSTQQAQDQALYDQFQRAIAYPGQQLATAAVPFGLYPPTGSNSSQNSSGKSGSVGLGK